MCSLVFEIKVHDLKFIMISSNNSTRNGQNKRHLFRLLAKTKGLSFDDASVWVEEANFAAIFATKHHYLLMVNLNGSWVPSRLQSSRIRSLLVWFYDLPL